MSAQNNLSSTAEWPKLDPPEKLQQFIDIIAEDGSVDRSLITPDATLETIGLASMDVVMILMGVEEKLGVYLPMNNDLSSAKNMSEFVAAIDQALGDEDQIGTTQDAQ